MYLRYVYLKFKYNCNCFLQKYALGLRVSSTYIPFACTVSTKICIGICREQRIVVHTLHKGDRFRILRERDYQPLQ
jgi:hypothetical protein